MHAGSKCRRALLQSLFCATHSHQKVKATMRITLALLAIASIADGFTAPHSRVVSSRAASGLSAATLESPPTEETKPQPEKDDQFDWFKSWYPVVAVDSLDPESPHAFKLLGMDIVVWNDGPVVDKKGNNVGLFGSKKNRPKGAKKVGSDEHWKVMADSCPHRKVPLSEGRVEDDGSLLCSYHGWRFDGEGGLMDVPQALPGELTKLQANPKSCAPSYPTKVVDGLLWVWPETTDDAKIESALAPVPSMKLPHEVDERVDESRVVKFDWNWRELPYGHDFFIENVVDPAHVPVSHHNVVGNRYKDATSQTMTMVKPMNKNGFNMKIEGASGFESWTNFTAPCTVGIEAHADKDGEVRQYLELYSSPSRPGFCNHVGRMVIVKDKNGNVPKMFKSLMMPIPKWLRHVTSALFLNQDALFLHTQERVMASNGLYSVTNNGDDYSKSVLPAQVDKGVLSFRNWIRTRAGGKIPYKGDTTMPPPSNEVVFDIWSSHTKNCKCCQTALKRAKLVRFASFVLAASMATIRPFGKVGSLASLAAFSGVALAADKLIGMFHRLEFSHSNND